MGGLKLLHSDSINIVKIIVFILVLLLTWILIRVNRVVFREIQKKKKGLQLLFFRRIIASMILIGGVILAFSVFGGMDSVWKSLLGGTAIFSAVIAFMAQDIVKDILAGLMITVYKPFEIGNRIELEDGTAGIVKDITMRHVVLQGMDTQTFVIPNSKLNTMKLKNFSYHAGSRSLLFVFHIGYGSDVEKAIEVIRNAVISSDHSIPGKNTDHGMDYAPVYFMAYEESSLRLETTVYYEPSSPTEAVKTDVNLRVNRALKENGIEIPFNYINVIQKKTENS